LHNHPQPHRALNLEKRGIVQNIREFELITAAFSSVKRQKNTAEASLPFHPHRATDSQRTTQPKQHRSCIVSPGLLLHKSSGGVHLNALFSTTFRRLFVKNESTPLYEPDPRSVFQAQTFYSVSVYSRQRWQTKSIHCSPQGLPRLPTRL
jgi:hypothetical protein